MKTSHFVLAAALFGAVGASAQTTEQTPGTKVKSDKHLRSCLMETDATAMTTLGLNADQIAQVESIRSPCKAHMKIAEAAKNPAGTDPMEKRTAALKDVLTPDQHSKWVAWCNERSTKSRTNR